MVKLNRPNRATSWRLSALLTVMAFGGACVQLLGLEPGELRGSATSSGAGGAGQGGTPLVLSFSAAVNSAGTQPRSVTAGDWNGDGKPDLAVANSASANVSILLGNGNGTFQMKADYAAGGAPSTVTAGDWNGDKKADLVVANDSVSILLGNGNGTFQAKVKYSAGDQLHSSVTAGDWNGDKKLDLAVAGGSSVSILLNTSQ